MSVRPLRTPSLTFHSSHHPSLALALSLAFAVGFGVGCQKQGMSEVDRELAKARKQATKREAAQCYPASKEPCYFVEEGKNGPEGTVGRGICREGERVCDAEGFWQGCTGAVLPGAETCNNIDDDCNGRVDDGFEREGTKCFAGDGECRAEGKFSCSADAASSVCSATAKPGKAEICDGKDNDCNGTPDDGDIAGTGVECNTKQPGACSTGIMQCTAGKVSCMPTHTRTVEICNKIDDDCDKTIDEDCISEAEARQAGLIK
jgi:hypothetical protein